MIYFSQMIYFTQAQLMSITLAQAFNTAYNLWKMRSDGSLQVAESSKIINGKSF